MKLNNFDDSGLRVRMYSSPQNQYATRLRPRTSTVQRHATSIDTTVTLDESLLDQQIRQNEINRQVKELYEQAYSSNYVRKWHPFAIKQKSNQVQRESIISKRKQTLISRRSVKKIEAIKPFELFSQLFTLKIQQHSVLSEKILSKPSHYLKKTKSQLKIQQQKVRENIQILSKSLNVATQIRKHEDFDALRITSLSSKSNQPAKKFSVSKSPKQQQERRVKQNSKIKKQKNNSNICMDLKNVLNISTMSITTPAHLKMNRSFVEFQPKPIKMRKPFFVSTHEQQIQRHTASNYLTEHQKKIYSEGQEYGPWLSQEESTIMN